MKALRKKLSPLTLFGIAVTSLFSIRPAQACTVTLEQVGSNVVATGRGAINLTGLTLNPGFVGGVGIQADVAEIITGQPAPAGVDAYRGLMGPMSFGPGDFFAPNTGSGDLVGIVGNFLGAGLLFVPQAYVSGAALSNSMTFNSATFASLGVTPGTYVWSWGDWATEPELQARHPRGWGARWWLDSFSARFRFARLGCTAAKVELSLTDCSEPFAVRTFSVRGVR